jgi:2-phospho-L-lactate guanylyltransferase
VRWYVIIPVRAAGKSRLGRAPEVARALALDTVDAAVAAGADVAVVTGDDALADEALALNARVVREGEPAGLAAAIGTGLSGVGDDVPRAVLLGDLPALAPSDLASALARALEHERAFVADADGTGSTLVTARGGVAFLHRFGPGSAQAHRDAGLIELALPPQSSLRRDVDLEEHLALLGERLGPRTRGALGL